jgi:ribosome-binding factor A
MGRKYQERVSELIHIRLMDLLERKIKDPRIQMVTITDVVITPDASRADVYFSVLGGESAREDAQAGLDSAAGWLRRELGRRLRLRQTPELVFHYDPSMKRGERIADILDELELSDEEEHPSGTS